MADIFDKEKRSAIMRQVKSKKNKSTELRLIKIFKENGVTGWKRNYPVKGHPDFVFLKQRIAVLWMVASGMGMIAEIHAHQQMRSFGAKSENGISSMIRK